MQDELINVENPSKYNEGRREMEEMVYRAQAECDIAEAELQAAKLKLKNADLKLQLKRVNRNYQKLFNELADAKTEYERFRREKNEKSCDRSL